jgi:MraZ protein
LELTNNSFTGRSNYVLDAKGRVNIPAKMRKALPPANDRTFIATRGPDPCIVLYPMEVWQQIEKKLINLNKRRVLHRHYTRNFVRHAEMVQYDQQGRIPVPTELIEYAGIDKDVEIVGMIDHIEIWDPDGLAEYSQQFENRADELDAIADEIFS